MCIIVVKPAMVEMPKMEILKRCFENNNDGAGFAYRLPNSEVHYQKGYMTFKSFKRALNKLDIDKTKATMVFHFRIGTAGTNSQGLTHPFRICDNVEDMKELKGVGDVLFHNGILSDYNPRFDEKRDVNDTMLFVEKIISKLPNKWEKNKAIKELIKNSIGHSKLAILKDTGLTMIGDFIKDGDLYFSNTSYKQSRYYSSYYDYGYDYDYPYSRYSQNNYSNSGHKTLVYKNGVWSYESNCKKEYDRQKEKDKSLYDLVTKEGTEMGDDETLNVRYWEYKGDYYEEDLISKKLTKLA